MATAGVVGVMATGATDWEDCEWTEDGAGG